MNQELSSTKTSFDKEIDQLCESEKEDWSVILEICDIFSSETKIKANLSSMAVLKRVGMNRSGPAYIAFALFDACFNNCGKDWQKAACQKVIIDEFKRLLLTKSGTPVKIVNKIKESMQNWVLDYGAQSYISAIYVLYNELNTEGHSFPALKRKLPTPPLAVTSAGKSNDELKMQEDKDLEAAIAASLKISTSSTNANNANTGNGDGQKQDNMYNFNSNTTTTTGAMDSKNLNHISNPKELPSQPQVSKKAKALYTFEVMEEGELGFTVGDVITILDTSHPEWWKGEKNGQVGLLPSNYVKLLENTTQQQGQVGSSSNGYTTDSVSKKENGSNDKAKIDVEVIDELLQKLDIAQNSQTTSEFNADIEKLYEQVVGDIQPLIEAKLDKLNQKEQELSELNAKYCKCMGMYDSLLKESQLAMSNINHIRSSPPPSQQLHNSYSSSNAAAGTMGYNLHQHHNLTASMSMSNNNNLQYQQYAPPQPQPPLPTPQSHNHQQQNININPNPSSNPAAAYDPNNNNNNNCYNNPNPNSHVYQ